MKKRLKTNGIIIFLAVVLMVLFPSLFLRNADKDHLDAAVKVYGITLVLLGQIMRTAARGYKSEYSHSGHALIQGGPYTLVRNPMYLGILSIGLGIVLVLFHWWVAVIFLSVFAWRYILLIFKEEEKLSGMFPREYRDYCRRVPRILPSPEMIVKKDMAEYLPLKWPWLKKEIGSVSAVLLLVFALRAWQDLRTKSINLCLEDIALLLSVIIIFIFLTIYLIRRTGKQQKDASDKGKNTL